MRPAFAPPCRRGCDWAGCPFTEQSIPPIPGCRSGPLPWRRPTRASASTSSPAGVAAAGSGRTERGATSVSRCSGDSARGEVRAQGLSLGVGVAVARAPRIHRSERHRAQVAERRRLAGIGSSAAFSSRVRCPEGTGSSSSASESMFMHSRGRAAFAGAARAPRDHTRCRGLQKSSCGESHRGDLGGMRALRDAGGGVPPSRNGSGSMQCEGVR